MAKKREIRSFRANVGRKIVEGLISYGAVYLLSPYLIRVLAPVQANINTNAAAAGQTVSNVGTSNIANALITAAQS